MATPLLSIRLSLMNPLFPPDDVELIDTKGGVTILVGLTKLETAKTDCRAILVTPLAVTNHKSDDTM